MAGVRPPERYTNGSALVAQSEGMATILVITSVHRPFDQRIFYKQARSLAGAGHQVTLIAPADFERRIIDGVTVLGVPRPRRRLTRPVTWLHLMCRVVRSQPDVVHFHDPELLLPAALIKLTLARQTRFIYDVHEYLVDSVREKTWLASWLRPGAAWTVERLEHLLARSVSGVVCVIEDQLPLYQNLSCPKVVVHNYPAVADFEGAKRPSEYEPDQFRLVYIGSLFERRGLWTLLEAFQLVVQRIPQAHLFLGGAYEDPAFERRVKGFATGNDLPVTFLGWVPYAQVKDYLTYAHCAWMPGLLTAQFSNRGLSTKILEAMVCGVPIVSADLPHRREFIEPAKAGMLVTPDDPKAHADAILWLYRNPEERTAMGARGSAWVLEKSVWEHESEVLLRFYEQLLAERRE